MQLQLPRCLRAQRGGEGGRLPPFNWHLWNRERGECEAERLKPSRAAGCRTTDSQPSREKQIFCSNAVHMPTALSRWQIFLTTAQCHRHYISLCSRGRQFILYCDVCASNGRVYLSRLGIPEWKRGKRGEYQFLLVPSLLRLRDAGIGSLATY